MLPPLVWNVRPLSRLNAGRVSAPTVGVCEAGLGWWAWLGLAVRIMGGLLLISESGRVVLVSPCSSWMGWFLNVRVRVRAWLGLLVFVLWTVVWSFGSSMEVEKCYYGVLRKIARSGWMDMEGVHSLSLCFYRNAPVSSLLVVMGVVRWFVRGRGVRLSRDWQVGHLAGMWDTLTCPLRNDFALPKGIISYDEIILVLPSVKPLRG